MTLKCRRLYSMASMFTQSLCQASRLSRRSWLRSKRRAGFRRCKGSWVVQLWLTGRSKVLCSVSASCPKVNTKGFGIKTTPCWSLLRAFTSSAMGLLTKKWFYRRQRLKSRLLCKYARRSHLSGQSKISWLLSKSLWASTCSSKRPACWLLTQRQAVFSLSSRITMISKWSPMKK